eukprot:gene28955-32149_t
MCLTYQAVNPVLPYDSSLQAQVGVVPSAGPPVELPEWKPPISRAFAITKRISQAENVHHLQQVLADNSVGLNEIHVSAAFSRVVKLVKAAARGRGLQAAGTRLLYFQLLPDLSSLAVLHLDKLSARSVSTIVHSLGVLEYMDHELAAELERRAEPMLWDFSTQGLANTMWGFAKLDHRPSPLWMAAFLAICLSSPCLASFKPQEMSSLLWSLVKIKFKVRSEKLEEVLVVVQQQLDEYSSQSLTMIVYSLACCEHQPGEAWLADFATQVVGPKLRSFTPQGLTQTLWALSKTGFVADAAFKSAVLIRVDQQLKQFNSTDQATVLYAFAQLQIQPGPAILNKLQMASFGDMWGMGAHDVTAIIWSFAKLGYVPRRKWLSRTVSVLYSHLPTLKPKELVMTIWALARYNLRPPAQFMIAFRHRLDVLAGEFLPQEIANTMWALARFGYYPSRALLAEFFMATNNRLSSFKAMELSHMIWALASVSHMRLTVDRQWLDEFMKSTFHKMSEFSPQGLNNTIWAMSKLKVDPTPAWLYCYCTACRQQLTAGSLSALDLGQIISSLRDLSMNKQLHKVDDLILDMVDYLAGVELQSQAYTQQQLSLFFSMRASNLTRSKKSLAAAGGGDSAAASSGQENGASNGQENVESAAASNGHENGASNGQENGASNGQENGDSTAASNGHGNGASNGHDNGASNKHQQGAPNGHENGALNGQENGASNGQQNGDSTAASNGHENGASNRLQEGASNGQGSAASNGHENVDAHGFNDRVSSADAQPESSEAAEFTAELSAMVLAGQVDIAGQAVSTPGSPNESIARVGRKHSIRVRRQLAALADGAVSHWQQILVHRSNEQELGAGADHRDDGSEAEFRMNGQRAMTEASASSHSGDEFRTDQSSMSASGGGRPQHLWGSGHSKEVGSQQHPAGLRHSHRQQHVALSPGNGPGIGVHNDGLQLEIGKSKL